jgi:hypothetical protein
MTSLLDGGRSKASESSLSPDHELFAKERLVSLFSFIRHRGVAVRAVCTGGPAQNP